MSLILVDDRIDEALGWIQDAGERLFDNLADDEIDAYLNSHQDIKAMWGKLQDASALLKSVWTPELLRQLEAEENEQSDMEDRTDAASY